MTFKQTLRLLLKRRRQLKRIRAMKIELVPPCPQCGSPEGCYSDCPVAPWNLED